MYVIRDSPTTKLVHKHNTHRWRAGVQRRIHLVLQQQRHQTLAEEGVKNMKALVERCNERKENLEEAIAAWRNMARNDGTTPAELFYGRKLRQTLPMLPITEWTDHNVSSRDATHTKHCLLYTSPSPRDLSTSRMPSSA